MSMDIDNDQIEIIQEFVTESQDMIEQLEPQIIELGQNSDPETMNAIFRLFHSMKGSAGFLLEFNWLARLIVLKPIFRHIFSEQAAGNDHSDHNIGQK